MKLKTPPIDMVPSMMRAMTPQDPLTVVMMAPTMVAEIMGSDVAKMYAHVKMEVLARMVKMMTPQDPLTVVMMAPTPVAEVIGSNMAKMHTHVKMQVLDWLVMAIFIFHCKIITTVLRAPIVLI